MIVRCEQCSTLYELDESLLALEGSPVQCAKCQHVFTVRAPCAAGQTLVGVPAATAAEAPPPPGQRAEARSAPGAAPGPEPEPVGEARPVRRAGPARPATVYRPPISQPAVSRPPILRRDTVGTFENRLRWSHRWRWLAPTLLVATAAAGAGAYLWRARAIDPRAKEAHQAALALALRDDVTSLEQAREQLEAALRTAPRLDAARADRTLVELLLAGALSGDAPGAAGPRRDEVAKLVAAANGTLDELQRARLAPAEVARARVVAAALGAERAEVVRLAAAARGELANDPLVEVAERSAEVRSGDRAARERAVGALRVLVTRRPDVLRARYVLAYAENLAGRRGEALSALEALLKANPRHERALALKETLGRPPAPPAQAVPVTGASAGTAALAPTAAARAGKAATAARKADSTGGEAVVPPNGGPAASPGSGAPARRPAPTPADEASAGTAAPEGTTGTDRPPGEAEPAPVAPRLRPAAVPEPEPVPSGG